MSWLRSAFKALLIAFAGILRHFKRLCNIFYEAF